MAGATTSLRLVRPGPGLLALPWERPLATWRDEDAAFVALPVGPSRHVVRFCVVDGDVLAVKELPLWPARREYEALRVLEQRQLPAVRAVGLAERSEDDAAILMTRFLARSFQYRRLFVRLREGTVAQRERLLDAMAGLLVELHRRGVFWGDCSLANTLLVRDGQTLQAHLVDAETSEVHDQLSDGQRAFDLELMVENVTGDLADVAALGGRGLEHVADDLAVAESVSTRYTDLWEELHREEPVAPDERYRVEARLRRLNDLGFVVDEVAFEPGPESEGLQFKVAVADRRYHAGRLRELTGLDVGEGQARILLNDLLACASEPGASGTTEGLARHWLTACYLPSVERLRATLGAGIDPVQAYCDLLEVRWLLSEQAGRDVGDEVALAALAARRVPPGSAADLAAAEAATGVWRVDDLRRSEPD
ncbi:MAG TPA: DUF4032 domain-containing protein [Candidatus Sulfotelmatobacter sp.]|nr:DUF4032 domain-containing protein [Candidatus Sulfotelmatobacter sp.]